MNNNNDCGDYLDTPMPDPDHTGCFVVGKFTNGFAKEAHGTHLRLRHLTYQPTITIENGTTVISVPADQWRGARAHIKCGLIIGSCMWQKYYDSLPEIV